jgi:2-keto-4-pentenoate hydratase/2-oxohepta-3-ene-1,7-dioic acid hydratase in catechol pathway
MCQALAHAELDGIADAAARADRIPCAEVEWLPVVPNPAKILCIGVNYENHRQETGRAASKHPTVFTRFADTLVGHHAPLVRPRASTMLDYEGELAVVIGRTCRSVARTEAMRHVAGYACFNDASVRDWQRHSSQFTPGKNFPGTGALGPALVTRDEIDDPRQLTIETRLNGEAMQHASLGDLIFDIPALVEYCSAFTALAPGDVIATGTPGGVGAARDPQVWLRSGDTVEVEISSVGLLSNGVIDEG